MVLVVWPLPGLAEEGGATIVGFSRNSKQLLLRQDRALVLLDRGGKRIEPSPRSERGHGHGTRLKRRDATRLTGKGLTLVLDPRGSVLLVRGKGRIRLHGAGKDNTCKVTGLDQGWRSPNRQVLALLVQRACPDRTLEPVLIVLPRVGRRLLHRSTALARRGQLKAAEGALAQAALLLPGSPRVIYRRACLAALRGDEQAALSALRRLKATSTAAARRLVVKARFERDFRLIQDSAAFKALLND